MTGYWMMILWVSAIRLRDEYKWWVDEKAKLIILYFSTQICICIFLFSRSFRFGWFWIFCVNNNRCWCEINNKFQDLKWKWKLFGQFQWGVRLSLAFFSFVWFVAVLEKSDVCYRLVFLLRLFFLNFNSIKVRWLLFYFGNFIFFFF